MPIPLILGGAALLGTGALGVGGARLLKDELNFTAQDAADQELQQGDRKGFNPEKGTIKRGLLEKTGDFLMGNSKEDILEAAKKGHLTNLTNSQAGDLLQQYRPGYEIKDNMTQKALNREAREVQRQQPYIDQISATGELAGKYTTEELQKLDVNGLQRVLKEATNAERITDYATNPIIQNNLEQARQDRITSDKRFNATQQLAITQMGLAQQQQANQMQIAQMNNQLQMRRQDSQDRRADRRDRQAMIQQLMGGLSALGTSIAI